MKKIILWFSLFCLSFSALSQTFGFKGGINLATQAWEVDGVKVHPNYRTGALAAATLNLEEVEKFSVQFELSYSQVGFGKTHFDGEEIPQGDFKYLKIGCAGKYYIIRTLNVHGGVELGFQFDQVKDLRYLYGPDFGIFIGSEYYFHENVGAGVRYYLGLSDINSGSTDVTAPTIKQFNRAFQLYVAFRIPGKQLKEMGY